MEVRVGGERVLYRKIEVRCGKEEMRTEFENKMLLNMKIAREMR